MVLQLIFKSFIHFAFILVYGMSWWSIFLQVLGQFSQHIIEEAIFTQFYVPAPFVKYYLTVKTWVYFWVFYSVPLLYASVLMPEPDCFDYSGLVI